MGRIIECTGRYASNPYYLEKVCYRIYSVEELCFYFCENTDLLERDIVNTGLANWLETECGLRELSDRLYKLITTGGTLAQFVTAVLDYVQFCSPKELKEIAARLSETGGLTPYQKRKRRADYFLNNRRYTLATAEYEALLAQVSEETERELCGDIYHGMGVANANLFFFEKAAAYFKKAYELDGNERHYAGYVAALRFMLPDMEFVRRVGEDDLMSREALRLEKRLEEITHAWQESSAQAELSQIQTGHEAGDTAYYQKIDEKVLDLVEEYRLITSE